MGFCSSSKDCFFYHSDHYQYFKCRLAFYRLSNHIRKFEDNFVNGKMKNLMSSKIAATLEYLFNTIIFFLTGHVLLLSFLDLLHYS